MLIRFATVRVIRGPKQTFYGIVNFHNSGAGARARVKFLYFMYFMVLVGLSGPGSMGRNIRLSRPYDLLR